MREYWEAAIYLLKVNNRNLRTKCEMLRGWRRSGVFIFNFKYISHLVPVLLLLTLNKQFQAGLDSPLIQNILKQKQKLNKQDF